jgi:hypothetical protein
MECFFIGMLRELALKQMEVFRKVRPQFEKPAISE